MDEWTHEEAAAARYQETIYFHRFVQRFLYGDHLGAGAPGKDTSPPMRVFRRCDISRVTVELASVECFSGKEKEQAEELWNTEVAAGRQPNVSSIGRLSTRAITLEVETINLHLFEAGVAILVVAIAAERGTDGAIAPIVTEDGAKRPANLPICSTSSNVFVASTCLIGRSLPPAKRRPASACAILRRASRPQ